MKKRRVWGKGFFALSLLFAAYTATAVWYALTVYRFLLEQNLAYEGLLRRSPFFLVSGGYLLAAFGLPVICLLLLRSGRAYKEVRDYRETKMLLRKKLQLAESSLRVVQEAGHSHLKQLELLLDNSQASSFEWDCETNSIRISHAAAVLGYDQTGLSKTHDILMMIHPDDRTRIFHELRCARNGEKHEFNCEHRLLTAANEWIWVSTRARPCEYNSNGRPVKFSGTAFDITLIKESQKESADLAKLRDLLLENSQAGILVFNQSGQCIYWNHAMEKITGVSRREIIGKPGRIPRILPQLFTDAFMNDLHRTLVRRHIITHPPEHFHFDSMHNGFLESTFKPLGELNGNAQHAVVFIRDVTVPINQERTLRNINRQFQLATEGSHIALFEWRIPQKEIHFINNAIETLIGRPLPGLTVHPETALRVIHPADRKILNKKLQNLLKQKEANNTWDVEVRLIKQRRWIWVRILANVAESSSNLFPQSIVGIIQEITEEKKRETILRHHACTDPLTGILNRREFMNNAEDFFNAADRENKPCSLLALDIDHFKLINDTYGHAAGDNALRCFVSLCKTCIRETDIFGRIGGEEFAVLLPSTEKSVAIIIAERIRKTIEGATIRSGETTLKLTASIGVSDNFNIRSFSELLQQADRMLYRAKRKNRNRVCSS